jgi:hypothetical protein
MEVKIVKKAAIICAMVLMISIVPAFALNQTANNTTAQVQDQSGTCDQTQAHNQDKNQNCQKDGTCTNCTTSDGNQHKYQYGLKNDNNGNNNCVEQANCPKT